MPLSTELIDHIIKNYATITGTLTNRLRSEEIKDQSYLELICKTWADAWEKEQAEKAWSPQRDVYFGCAEPIDPHRQPPPPPPQKPQQWQAFDALGTVNGVQLSDLKNPAQQPAPKFRYLTFLQSEQQGKLDGESRCQLAADVFGADEEADFKAGKLNALFTLNPKFQKKFMDLVLAEAYDKLETLPLFGMLYDQIKAYDLPFKHDGVLVRIIVESILWLQQHNLATYWDVVIAVAMMQRFENDYMGAYVIALTRLRLPRSMKFAIFKLTHTLASSSSRFKQLVSETQRGITDILTPDRMYTLTINLLALSLVTGAVPTTSPTGSFWSMITSVYSGKLAQKENFVLSAERDPFLVNRYSTTGEAFKLMKGDYVNAIWKGFGLTPQSAWISQAPSFSQVVEEVEPCNRAALCVPQKIEWECANLAWACIFRAGSSGLQLRELLASAGKLVGKKDGLSAKLDAKPAMLLATHILMCLGWMLETWTSPAKRILLNYSIAIQDILKEIEEVEKGNWTLARDGTQLSLIPKNGPRPSTVSADQVDKVLSMARDILIQRCKMQTAIFQIFTEMLAGALLFTSLYALNVGADREFAGNVPVSVPLVQVLSGTDPLMRAYVSASTLMEMYTRSEIKDATFDLTAEARERILKLTSDNKSYTFLMCLQAMWLCGSYLLAQASTTTTADAICWSCVRQDDRERQLPWLWLNVSELVLLFVDKEARYDAKAVPATIGSTATVRRGDPSDYEVEAFRIKADDQKKQHDAQVAGCVRLRDKGYVDPTSDCQDNPVKRIRIGDALETRAHTVNVPGPTMRIPAHACHSAIVNIMDVSEFGAAFQRIGLEHGYAIYERNGARGETYMAEVDFTTANKEQANSELLALSMLDKDVATRRISPNVRSLLPVACVFVYAAVTSSVYRLYRRVEFGREMGLVTAEDRGSNIMHYPLVLKALLAVLSMNASFVAHRRIHPGALLPRKSDGLYFIGKSSHAITYSVFLTMQEKTKTPLLHAGFEQDEFKVFRLPAPSVPWTAETLTANDVWGVVTSLLAHFTGHNAHALALRVFFLYPTQDVFETKKKLMDLDSAGDVLAALDELFAIVQKKVQGARAEIGKDAATLCKLMLLLALYESKITAQLRIVINQVSSLRVQLVRFLDKQAVGFFRKKYTKDWHKRDPLDDEDIKRCRCLFSDQRVAYMYCSDAPVAPPLPSGLTTTTPFLPSDKVKPKEKREQSVEEDVIFFPPEAPPLPDQRTAEPVPTLDYRASPQEQSKEARKIEEQIRQKEEAIRQKQQRVEELLKLERSTDLGYREAYNALKDRTMLDPAYTVAAMNLVAQRMATKDETMPRKRPKPRSAFLGRGRRVAGF